MYIYVDILRRFKILVNVFETSWCIISVLVYMLGVAGTSQCIKKAPVYKPPFAKQMIIWNVGCVITEETLKCLEVHKNGKSYMPV